MKDLIYSPISVKHKLTSVEKNEVKGFKTKNEPCYLSENSVKQIKRLKSLLQEWKIKQKGNMFLPVSILHETSYWKGKSHVLQQIFQERLFVFCGRGEHRHRRGLLTFFEGHKRGRATRTFKEQYPDTSKPNIKTLQKVQRQKHSQQACLAVSFLAHSHFSIDPKISI